MMSDLYLIKKVIILKKIQAAMKTFVPPFFNHFNLSLNQKKKKKTCGNESHENETKLIYNSAADLLHIRKRNLNWYKFGHCKNEAREIHCPCCRQVDVILIASAKI